MPILIRVTAVIMLVLTLLCAVARPAPPRDVAEPTGYRIDINRAGPAELRLLPGIGPVTADRIVEARTEAPFERAEQLERVHRIGPVTVENVAPFIKTASQADGRTGGAE